MNIKGSSTCSISCCFCKGSSSSSNSTTSTTTTTVVVALVIMAAVVVVVIDSKTNCYFILLFFYFFYFFFISLKIIYQNLLFILTISVHRDDLGTGFFSFEEYKQVSKED